MFLRGGDSTPGHSFGVEIDGVVMTEGLDVSGLTMELVVIELRESTPGGEVVIRKLPGRPRAGEVTLTRPLTADGTFSQWVEDSGSADFDGTRRGGTIIVYDEAGSPLQRYTLRNAWPRSLAIEARTVDDRSVVFERLVVAHEGVSPA
jgi:phage tail-like protein